jgi:hypothetical protein
MRQMVYGTDDDDLKVSITSNQLFVDNWLSTYWSNRGLNVDDRKQFILTTIPISLFSNAQLEDNVTDVRIGPWQSIHRIPNDKRIRFFVGRYFYFHSTNTATIIQDEKAELKKLILRHGGIFTNTFYSHVTDIIVHQFVTIQEFLSIGLSYKDMKRCHFVTKWWVYSCVSNKKIIRRTTKYTPKHRLLWQLVLKHIVV